MLISNPHFTQLETSFQKDSPKGVTKCIQKVSHTQMSTQKDDISF